jgi:hypothetical protein
MAAVWRARPVFITNTFRDMHAERDHLRNVVFPTLEERLRERLVYLEQRSRPCLIALIGGLCAERSVGLLSTLRFSLY